MKTLYADRIPSVKGDVQQRSDLELLTDLLGRFDATGLDDKILAIAVGVSASRMSTWRSRVKGRKAIRLNNETRYEILSLLGESEDQRIKGMEWTVAEMKARVLEYEQAARLRRILPSATHLTPESAASEVARRYAQDTRRAKGKGSKRGSGKEAGGGGDG